MPIGESEKKYLRNKYKGGMNNKKGAMYENYYATYCIARLMNIHIKNLDNVYLTSQCENCFVDDLLINEPTLNSYHQLKDVKDLTWNSSITNDFKRQKEELTGRGENFLLKLIYSCPERDLETIPSEIKSCTVVERFPASKSINNLILSYPPFKEVILKISHPVCSEDDKLSGIASAILGVWESSDQKRVSLKQISERVRSIGNGYLNIKTYPNVQISTQCMDIFNNCQLKYHTSGIMLYWSNVTGNFKGEIEWTSKLEEKISSIRPTDFWELITLLSPTE